MYQELIGSWLASFPGSIKQFSVLSSPAGFLRLVMIQLFISLSVSQNSETLPLSGVYLWSVSPCCQCVRLNASSSFSVCPASQNYLW